MVFKPFNGAKGCPKCKKFPLNWVLLQELWKIKGKRADIKEILVPDATHSLGGIITELFWRL